MKQLLVLLTVLPLACATPHGRSSPSATSVDVLSYNQSAVDVYSLCAEREARWLGVVPKRGVASFAIPSGKARCVRGLRFFLLVREAGRGYWVGPFRMRDGAPIALVIEKYAALSSARSDLRAAH